MSSASLRIISLLPSATEIVCALGLRNNLVGRSHECDYPLEVTQLPVCSQPRYRSEGNSVAINKAILDILEEALSIYRVDVEAIKALRPTHIITQSQCEVCAVSTDELQAALHEYLKEDDIKVIDLNPATLQQVFTDIRVIASAFGVIKRGEALMGRMQEAFDNVHGKTKSIAHRPSIVHIEWIEPVLVAGHWMMNLIAMAGGANLFTEESKRWISFEQLCEKNPEKILIAPCGFSIQRSLGDMYLLEGKERWKEIQAVRDNEVYLGDGNQYFNRPGPRLVDSLEILAEIFHPGIFLPVHYSSGWIKRFDN